MVLFLDKLEWRQVKNVFSGKKYREATHPHFWMWIRRYYRGFMHAKGYRIERIGEENIPNGAAILAPNHRSIWDGLVVIWALRSRVPGTVGKNSLFKVPVLAQLLKLADVMPVPHGKKAGQPGHEKEKMADSVKDRIAHRIFGRGRMLQIYPEGGVYHTAEVSDLRSGAVSMAYRYNVPIVPVGIGGVEHNKETRRLKRTGLVVVVFGKPINAAEWLVANGFTLRTIDDLEERKALYARFNTEVLAPAMQAVYDAAEARAALR